ncbi:MAG: response regulator transcription factor [Ginsengibacter sp.]
MIMVSSTRIGIVDDKAVNRTSIAGKIKEFEDLDLCFIAENGDDCLDQLKGLPPGKMPHVIFMDLEMPGMDGISAIQFATALYPEIFSVVLTIFDDDDKIFEAIKAGAHGYLLKDENAIALHNAINSVVNIGGAPMSPGIARKALQLLCNSEQAMREVPQTQNLLTQLLTDREKEILSHIIAGYDAKKIASILFLSVLTIRKHIGNIYHKLHVNTKAQAIILAHKNKWKG